MTEMTEVKTGEASKKPLFFTKRTDEWMLGPLSIALGLVVFVFYVTFRVFENNYYEVGNLLSPFYSPKIPWPYFLNGLPQFIKSPAILILWIPCLFRATCYYFRRAYYRAFFVTPPACAVSGYKKILPPYTGETQFPFWLQNLHRYMFYLASLSLVGVWCDFSQTLFAKDHFFNFGYIQFSVGTLVFFVDTIWLSSYLMGCHAFRHLIGGRLDCFSCGEEAKTCFSFWKNVTKLNERHELWAWLSLLSVAGADFYTRCVATGSVPGLPGFHFTDFVFFSMAAR